MKRQQNHFHRRKKNNAPFERRVADAVRLSFWRERGTQLPHLNQSGVYHIRTQNNLRPKWVLRVANSWVYTFNLKRIARSSSNSTITTTTTAVVENVLSKCIRFNAPAAGLQPVIISSHNISSGECEEWRKNPKELHTEPVGLSDGICSRFKLVRKMCLLSSFI